MTELLPQRPPKQLRSHRTLERIARASFEILEEDGAGGLTVHAVIARARSSVGSFYARFSGRDELLAYLGEMPVLGAPGCARSLKTNAIDWVLPRLLAGERLTFGDLASLGHGGLLEDTGKRPMPRNRLT